MKNNLLFLIIFLSLLQPISAITSKSGPFSFIGENGTIDTGYRSKIYYNQSGMDLGRQITIRASNIIEVDSGRQLDNSEYNITWYYYQTNLFQKSIPIISNEHEITINIDWAGFNNNETALIWRLVIVSIIDGDIEATTLSFGMVNGIIEMSPTLINPEESSFDLMLIVYALVIILVVILITKGLAKYRK